MSKRQSNSTKRQASRELPQRIAIRIADRYFAALAEDLPMDTAPGDLNLVYQASYIEEALEYNRRATGAATDIHDTALRAGYLLGIQVGLRMAGGGR